MEKKLSDNYLGANIYVSTGIAKLKWFLIGSTIFLLTFLYYFPLKDMLHELIQTQMENNPKCPLTYRQMNFSAFPPKVNFSDLRIPSQCFNGAQGMSFKDVDFNFQGLSLSPLGVKIGAETKYKNSLFDIRAAVGNSSQAIRIENTYLHLEDFGEYLPLRFLGKVKVQALIDLENQDLTEGNIRLLSTNFSIPAQNFRGFALPALNFKNFHFKGTMTAAKNIAIHTLQVGDPKGDSPVQGNFEGSVRLDAKNILNSDIDIKGQFRLSSLIKEKYGIFLNMFLGQKAPEEGLYKVHLGGKLGSPKTL